jgi:hypothetical protein
MLLGQLWVGNAYFTVLSMMEVFCIGTSNKSQSDGYAAMGDCSNFAPIRTTVRGVHSLIARVNVLPECAQAFGAQLPKMRQPARWWENMSMVKWMYDLTSLHSR